MAVSDVSFDALRRLARLVDTELQLFADQQQAVHLLLLEMTSKVTSKQGFHDLHAMENSRLGASTACTIDRCMKLATATGDLNPLDVELFRQYVGRRVYGLTEQILLEHMPAVQAARQSAERECMAKEERERNAAAVAETARREAEERERNAAAVAETARRAAKRLHRQQRGRANAELAAVPVVAAPVVAAPAVAAPPPMAIAAADVALDLEVAAANEAAGELRRRLRQGTIPRLSAPTGGAQQEVEPVAQPQTSKKEQKKQARDDERLRQKKLEEEKKRAAVDEENARIRKAVDLAHIDDPRRKDGQIVEDSTHDENKASRATGNIEAKNAKAQSKAEATSKSNAEATEVYNSLFK
jgi:hypothetical protein